MAANGKEPIAIVGIGCRFPGKLDTPETLWRFLVEEGDAIAPVPPSRWNNDAFYGGPTPLLGKTRATQGGFLDRVDEFDAGFFAIPEKEAAQIDPQHRVLLEVTCEALEDSGTPARRIQGTRTGVFVGIANLDYGVLQFSDLSTTGAFSAVNSKHYMAANRISYFLDLKGPSIAMDAACATSLYAVHMACQSIWEKESDMAFACGVNLMLAPFNSISFSALGTLSPTSRCH